MASIATAVACTWVTAVLLLPMAMAGEITALKAQARNKGRVNVYLDGRFAFGLSRLTAAWLQVGQALSDAEVERLQAADAQEAVHQRALRYLEHRPRAEAEVRRHLKAKGVPDEAADEELARLRRAGLVDDEAFARFWLENRTAFRPRSRRALRAELRLKGIPSETADEVLSEAQDDESAYRVAKSRAPRLKDLPREEFFRKLGEHLARRGYDFDIISPVVERLWQETGAGEDEH